MCVAVERIGRKIPMRQPNDGAIPVGNEDDLNGARARRREWIPPLPSPGKHDAAIGDDLHELPPGHVRAVDIHPVHTTRTWVEWACLPFQRAILAGSVKNEKMVSGRAAILISRVMTLVSTGVILGGPPFLDLSVMSQTLQTLVPKRLQEGFQLRQALRARPIEPPRPLSALSQQSCMLEDAEVLRNGRAGDFEVGGDFPSCQFPAQDEAKNRPPAGVDEGTKRSVHL